MVVKTLKPIVEVQTIVKVNFPEITWDYEAFSYIYVKFRALTQ